MRIQGIVHIPYDLAAIDHHFVCLSRIDDQDHEQPQVEMEHDDENAHGRQGEGESSVDLQITREDFFETQPFSCCHAPCYEFSCGDQKENETNREKRQRKKPRGYLNAKIEILDQIEFFAFLKANVLNDHECFGQNRRGQLEPAGLDNGRFCFDVGDSSQTS